ncbi:Biopolymer transport protein ExbD/TolR [compost metagenome]
MLDGQSVEPTALVAALTAKKPAKGNLQVVVGADRNVMHGRVVEVMDAVRQAGITDLAFAVERP